PPFPERRLALPRAHVADVAPFALRPEGGALRSVGIERVTRPVDDGRSADLAPVDSVGRDEAKQPATCDASLARVEEPPKSLESLALCNAGTSVDEGREVVGRRGLRAAEDDVVVSRPLDLEESQVGAPPKNSVCAFGVTG